VSENAQQEDADDPWWSTLWGRYKTWATELGLSWSAVLRRANVADNERVNKMRVKRGESREVREAIEGTLIAAESVRKEPTETGSIILGVEKWAEIGRHLAAIDRSLFFRLLAASQEHLAEARRAQESPFFNLKPADPKSKR
jgi:hypothetical protein